MKNVFHRLKVCSLSHLYNIEQAYFAEGYERFYIRSFIRKCNMKEVVYCHIRLRKLVNNRYDIIILTFNK